MSQLLDMPIMNAAGWCKTLEEVERLAKVPLISEITVGSITVNPLPGNSGNTFWHRPNGIFALNSLGLPNRGIPYYREELPKMQKVAHAAGKKLRVSIAGFSPEDYHILAREVEPYADVIEVNLGCPNVWGNSGQKPIACFNPEATTEIVRKTLLDRKHNFSCALKLSWFEPSYLSLFAETVAPWAGNVNQIVCCNTIPNCIEYDGAGKAVITPAEGLAGLSGAALKPMTLGNVVQFKKHLPKTISVIGCGGIHSGKDLFDYHCAGADGVQVGTAYFTEGAKVFNDLAHELSGFTV